MQIAEMECKQTGGDPSCLDLSKLSQSPPYTPAARNAPSREDTSAANVKKAKANRVNSFLNQHFLNNYYLDKLLSLQWPTGITVTKANV